MRVHNLAKNLKIKSKDVVAKLALLKIDVTPSSKIDEATSKKVKLLIQQPVRVQKIAKELGLSVEKLLKKLTKMNIKVISHLSLLHEPELVRLLKLKTLDELKIKSTIKRPKKAKLKILKIKPKKKRVFEVASELNVSKHAILKKLRKMNSLAFHGRSPLEPEIIKRLKAEKYKFTDRVVYKLSQYFDEIPQIIDNAKSFFTSTAFAIFVLVLIGTLVLTNVFIVRNMYVNQKLFEAKGKPISESKEAFQVVETLALLEIKKLGHKIPIIEEGKDESPITAVLTHKNSSVSPGDKGSSILIDSKNTLGEKFKAVSANDILIIENVNGDKYFFRVLSGNQAKGANKGAFKSIIKINLAKGRKIVAVLQKIE